MSRQRACVILLALLFLWGSTTPVHGQPPSDEFFIISSINPSKQQVVLKRPTEVTLVMTVNAETKYLDRSGRVMTLNELHAGDTVYVREKHDSAGSVAAEIRKGPMTVAELRKRYLATKP